MALPVNFFYTDIFAPSSDHSTTRSSEESRVEFLRNIWLLRRHCHLGIKDHDTDLLPLLPQGITKGALRLDYFFSSNAKVRVSQSNGTPAFPVEFSFLRKCGKFKGWLGLERRNVSLCYVTCLKLFYIRRDWRFRQPEPYFCHGVHVHTGSRSPRKRKCSACFPHERYCTTTTTPEYSYLNKRTIFTFIL